MQFCWLLFSIGLTYFVAIFIVYCFRNALQQEKKNRQATKGIDSRRLKESCWCSCFGWYTSECCCKGESCYSHDIRAILQEIRATSDTICRPVYATTQIFTDEEERILSDYLLRATKLHYSLSWKTTQPIHKTMSKLILTDYINVANRGTNLETGNQPIRVMLSLESDDKPSFRKEHLKFEIFVVVQLKGTKTVFHYIVRVESYPWLRAKLKFSTLKLKKIQKDGNKME